MRCAGLAFFMVMLLCLPVSGKGQRLIPAPAAVVMNKAERLQAAGKTAESIDLLESFQLKREKVSPAAADARGYTHYLIDFMLGNFYLLREDPAAAVSHYQAAVEKVGDSVEAWFNLARALYAAVRLAEAGQAFVTAHEISGGQNGEALYYGAVCFIRAGDYQRALTVFERLLRDHPRDLPLEWRSTLARLYLAMDMPARALPQVEILADQAEGNRQVEWRETMIYLYSQLHQQDKALDRVHFFIKGDPLEAKWWKIHAWLLLGQQDFRRALASLTAFSYLQPLSNEERVLLGDVNFMANVPIEAARHYENRLARDKETGVIKRTVRSYLRLYDERQALAWIERGLGQAPADEELLQMKGYLLYKAGRLEEAAAVYESLAEKAPQSGEAWLMKGYIAWRLGDIKAAREAFSRVNGHDGLGDQAREALAKMR